MSPRGTHRRSAFHAAAGLLTAGMLSMPAHATVYYLSTGHTGAQTQIDIDHTTDWTFTANSAWDLGGVEVTMKEGSQSGTSQDSAVTITLRLFEGSNASGVLLGTFSVTEPTFCDLHNDEATAASSSADDNCQGFNAVPYHTPIHFPTAYTLSQGSEYYVALTSNATDAQNFAFFIKGQDQITFNDASGNVLPDGTPVVSATEPVSLAVLATGILGLGAARRRRSK